MSLTSCHCRDCGVGEIAAKLSIHKSAGVDHPGAALMLCPVCSKIRRVLEEQLLSDFACRLASLSPQDLQASIRR